MALYPADAKPAEAVAYGATRSITAAAARVNLNSRSEMEATRQRASGSYAWQVDAWQCFRNVGEVNYSFNYAAAVVSRIRFHSAVVVSQDSTPVDIASAIKIATGEDGQTHGNVRGIDPRLAKQAYKHMQDLIGCGMSTMAKSFALNFQVAGECYLACIDDRWSVRSTSEIKIDASGRATLRPSMVTGTMTPKVLRKGTPIGRIWNQDPEHSLDPASSLQAVIPECEELILLGRLARVTARSRLNAGVMFVPDGFTASAQSVTEATAGDPATESIEDDEETFEKELFESFTAPVSQEDSAAALVPLLIRGPADQGDKLKWFAVSRDIGEQLEKRSDKALTRVLQGINAPKELATGMSQSRYANAHLIDEQTYKALVEPLALVFADAITDIYLRPLLRADTLVQEWVKDTPEILDQIKRIVCWYDPSEVVTSVDQSQAANDGWDRNVLSDGAWRKAHGFNDSDKPTELELASRLALKQVAIPPEVIQSLIKTVLPSIFAQAQEFNQAANGGGMPSGLTDILNGGGGTGAGTGDSTVAPSPPVPAASAPAGV